jgi:hypothetical protein
MSPFHAAPLAVVLSAVVAALAVGCTASSTDTDTSAESALETSRKYAALAGTWEALDPVPPASADGIPSYTTYIFDADGTFRASRSCRDAEDAGAVSCDSTITVSGTWQIYTTLPNLPRLDMTFSWTRETYVFSMQCDLLVLDGVDALFHHDPRSLPEVADGAICEDASWNSLAVCPPDIGDCDHETHRCLPPS